MADLVKIAFTVAGVKNGTVSLPCDNTTTVDIVFTLSATLKAADPVPLIVKIWVGEEHFVDTDLITDTMSFAGAPGTPILVTHTYQLKCNNRCKLTPIDPPGVNPAGRTPRLKPNGGRMQIECAYLDKNYGFSRFGTWNYSANSVIVQCVSGASSVQIARVRPPVDVPSADRLEDIYKIKQRGGLALITKHDLARKARRP